MDLKSVMQKYEIPENIEGTCSMENIEKNRVSFLSDINYKKFLKPYQGVIILTSQKNYEKIKDIKGNTYIVVENPHHAFIGLHNTFYKNFKPFNTGNEKPQSGKNCKINKTVRFGRNVKIGNNVTIFPYTVIGSDVSIGDNTCISSSVSIYDNVKIGGNCMIDAGATIGGEGFSTIYNRDYGAMRLINIGGVKIGDYVNIGNNTTIDRASFLYTKIHNRVLIDNLVHIGHNVSIGEDTRIAALSCIGGSCKIGKRVWIGIGCTLRDHIEIGDDCEVLMNAVLINSIENGERVGGFYAIPHRSWKEYMLNIRNKYVKK